MFATTYWIDGQQKIIMHIAFLKELITQIEIGERGSVISTVSRL